MTKNIYYSLLIILLGAIISGGIYFSNYKIEAPTHRKPAIEFKTIEINPINEEDIIIGNPNAKIFIMEYTHFECPYSQHFHQTMRRIISEYGGHGLVAWIIRHYPVPEIYPNSYEAAQAIECVANAEPEKKETVWNFLDLLLSTLPAEVTPSVLRETAITIGVNPDQYDSCIITKKYDSKIQRDIEDAKKLIEADDEFMTPYNLIITDNGKQTRVSGSMRYEDLKKLIDEIIIEEI